MNGKADNKLKGTLRRIASALFLFALYSFLFPAAVRAEVPKAGGTYRISDDLAAGNSGSVDQAGGTLLLSGSLGQVAVSRAGAGGLEVESGYFSKYVSVPAALSYAGVYYSSVSVAGSDAASPNPSGTVYETQVSTASDFSGAVISNTSTAWPAILGGLTGDAAYYTRVRAGYMGEDLTPYASLPPFHTLSESRTGTKIIDFDTVDASAQSVDAGEYLGRFGITISGVTPGSTVAVINNGNMYGGKAALPYSAPNYMTQIGVNDPVSFTLSFSVPVDSFSFVRPELLTGPTGITHPAWSANAFDAAGLQVSLVQEAQIASYYNVAPRKFVLDGAGARIASVRFNSDNAHFCAFSGVLLDDLELFAPAMSSLAGVRAAIKDPQAGKRINGNEVNIVAELILGKPELAKQVRFQYRVSGSGTWNDIVVSANDDNHPNPDIDAPYFVHWDASAMPENSYELRAVATDLYNRIDAAAPTVTVLVSHGNADISGSGVSGEHQTDTRIDNAVASSVRAGDSHTSHLAEVLLPAGAVSAQSATLTLINNPAAKPAPPDGAQNLDLSVKVDLSNGQHILSGGKMATITLTYNDADDDGIVDGTQVEVSMLKFYYASSAAGPWQPLDSTVIDTKNKTISGLTPHFSIFAVFGVAAANLGNVRVYPVPYLPNDGKDDNGKPYSAAVPDSGMIFDELPAAVKIRIFTLSGQLVAELASAASGGKIQWDVRNTKGEDAASGGYIAVITSPGNKTVIKKLLVLR